MHISGTFITVTLFLFLSALLPALPTLGRTQESASVPDPPLQTQAIQIVKAPWSALSLSGTKLGTTLRVNVRLGPAAEVAELEPWTGLPQTAACGPPPEQAAMLSTSLSIKGLLRNSRYSEGLWFDQAGSAYKRLRYNQEPGKYWLKEYCWKKNGVHRSKLAPADEEEKLHKPGAWQEQTSSWYALPERPAQCTSLSDPALLIVLASTMAQEPQERSLSLCTFGRRQLFQLEMTRETGEAQAVSYRILQDSRPAQERSGRIKPLVYRITAQQVQTDDMTEAFSLMGLEEDIRIFVDPATYLPIRLSGTARMAGKVELDLAEARIN